MGWMHRVSAALPFSLASRRLCEPIFQCVYSRRLDDPIRSLFAPPIGAGYDTPSHSRTDPSTSLMPTMFRFVFVMICLFAPWMAMWLPVVNVTAQDSINPAGETAGQNPLSPNIVVIFIDDMGYADINPFGATAYRTPNLNRMASEGRRFTDFVVSSAVCSASRSALMTGCYHRRVGISGALGPKSNIGLSPHEVTIAEICKSKGYATAAFGKWHLGHDPKFLPIQHGFDEFYGIPYSNDMWPLHPDSVAKRERDPDAKINWPALPMIHATADGAVQIVNDDMQPKDQEQMTTEFTRRSVEFIKKNGDSPFFLYLPHPMVHVPLYASEKFRGKSGAGTFR